MSCPVSSHSSLRQAGIGDDGRPGIEGEAVRVPDVGAAAGLVAALDHGGLRSPPIAAGWRARARRTRRRSRRRRLPSACHGGRFLWSERGRWWPVRATRARAGRAGARTATPRAVGEGAGGGIEAFDQRFGQAVEAREHASAFWLRGAEQHRAEPAIEARSPPMRAGHARRAWRRAGRPAGRHRGDRQSPSRRRRAGCSWSADGRSRHPLPRGDARDPFLGLPAGEIAAGNHRQHAGFRMDGLPAPAVAARNTRRAAPTAAERSSSGRS